MYNECFKEMYNDAIDQLIETIEDNNFTYYSDLHNEAFNTTYYVTSKSEAMKYLEGDKVFTAIGIIYQYEKDTFREVYTDCSDPVKIVNMLYYIIGIQVMIDGEFWEEFPENDMSDDDVNRRLINILNDMKRNMGR